MRATTFDRLYVLYDPSCGFCVRCAAWIHGQRTYLPVLCWPLDDERVKRRFPKLRPAGKDELTVIDSAGGVYRGAKGWLMTLWALQDYRAWAARLARPGLLPLARNAFELVSSNRHVLSRLLRLKGERELHDVLATSLGPTDQPRCQDGSCATPAAPVASSRIFCTGCQGHLPKDARRCPWCGLWLEMPGARA